MKLAVLPARLIDGWKLTQDILEDRVPTVMKEAGFKQVHETGQISTIFGSLAWWVGSHPEPHA
jgi:hypothetical protein